VMWDKYNTNGMMKEPEFRRFHVEACGHSDAPYDEWVSLCDEVSPTMNNDEGRVVTRSLNLFFCNCGIGDRRIQTYDEDGDVVNRPNPDYFECKQGSPQCPACRRFQSSIPAGGTPVGMIDPTVGLTRDDFDKLFPYRDAARCMERTKRGCGERRYQCLDGCDWDMCTACFEREPTMVHVEMDLRDTSRWADR
jgi:hypothetical protein